MNSPEEPSLQKENQQRGAPIAQLEGRLGGSDEERRLYEEQHARQLGESGGFFQIAVENSTDAIARVDTACRYLYVNAAFAQLIGRSPDAIVGKTNRELCKPAPLASIREEHVRGVFDSGRTLETDDSFPTPRGVRFFRTRYIPEYGPGGTVASVVAMHRDITDRRRSDVTLRESEERMRFAQQLAKIGAFDWNIQTGASTWTPEVEALYGLPPGSFPGTEAAWEDLVHPDDRALAVRLVKESFAAETPVDGEWRVILPDGSVRWLAARWQVFKNSAGEPLRMKGVNMDVTDRKRAEVALYESAQQYKEVFDNISVCLFVLDVTPEERFKIAAFNPAEEELVGLSNAQVCGRFIDDLFPGDVADGLIASYRRCLEAGRTIRFDHELNLPGRGRRFFHSNLIPLRNAAGVINRIIGACVETTDFKRTQEEALAKQNLETLGVLAGGIAHDFNNVLGGIHAQAELIEVDLAAGSAALEELQKIKVAASRGSEIVRELMVYAGQDQSQFDNGIDISRLIEEMLGLLRVSISKHSALRTDLGADLPAVSGNAPQVRQVVMNLVINASEAIGHKDGVITLATAHVKGGKDLGVDGPPDLPQVDYVRLEVADTGCGIAEEAKAKIFDPFFTTKFAGRGMGLAVVQRIVHDHGGAIRVATSLSQGTTFQVFLPCATMRASKKQSSIPVTRLEQGAARKGTILVADDEELLREAVSKSLRRLGFPVMEARDGSEAMELMRAHKDELEAVLLDVTLPGTSSLEILKEARRIRPNMRVVVTSAYSKETVDAAFAGLRVDYFIRKPFRLTDLRGLLTAPMSF